MSKSVFITGIPAAGKSYTAKAVAQKTGSLHVDIDDLRGDMAKNPHLEPWVNFFWHKDEETYWKTTTPEKHWENLVKQSEAVWPTILKYIHEIQQTGCSAIFEGVNILPHLAHRDLDFPGAVLLGTSEKEIFERCRKEPRWGKTENMQQLEAKWFFTHEATYYRSEAKKYGYTSFHDSTDAEIELLKIMC